MKLSWMLRQYHPLREKKNDEYQVLLTFHAQNEIKRLDI